MTSQTLGASGSAQFNLVSKWNFSLLLKVKSCAEFLSLSKARIEQYEKELDKIKHIIPFDQKTIENVNEVFPETKLDKKKYLYWPHRPFEYL